MNREIKFIVIHNTRTFDVTTVADLRAYWKQQNQKPRFHCIVDTMGHAHRLLGANFETQQYLIREEVNAHCFHLAYLGGCGRWIDEADPLREHRSTQGKDTRTPVQTHVLFEKIEELRKLYPAAVVIGADELILQATGRITGSPGFDVKGWLSFHSVNCESWIPLDIEFCEKQEAEQHHLEIQPIAERSTAEFISDASGLEWNAPED